MLSRYHRIPECDGQIDGRTGRIAISISRINMLARFAVSDSGAQARFVVANSGAQGEVCIA